MPGLSFQRRRCSSSHNSQRRVKSIHPKVHSTFAQKPRMPYSHLSITILKMLQFVKAYLPLCAQCLSSVSSGGSGSSGSGGSTLNSGSSIKQCKHCTSICPSSTKQGCSPHSALHCIGALQTVCCCTIAYLHRLEHNSDYNSNDYNPRKTTSVILTHKSMLGTYGVTKTDDLIYFSENHPFS